MSEKLPRYTAKEVLKKLNKLKYIQQLWQTWSHKRFINTKSKERFTLPFHSKNYIHPKILKDIINKCDLNVEEFKEL